MNTSWSIRLKEFLVGLDGGVPVIVQGYGSILLSLSSVSCQGKKVVTRRDFVLLQMNQSFAKGFFVFLCKKIDDCRKVDHKNESV